MNDNHNDNDNALDGTRILYVDIAPLKKPGKQKSMLDKIPASIRFKLDDGVQLEAECGQKIMIGRIDPRKDDRIDLDFSPHNGKKRGVSRTHAIINVSQSGVFIKDLDSTNGTFINGQQLYPMRKYALEDGDKLTIGHVEMETHFVFPE